MKELEKLPRTDYYGNKLFFERGIYVSKDGRYITKPKQGTTYMQYYHPRIDKSTHREYIINGGDRLYIDELVATCYIGRPRNKRRYYVEHRDGNTLNCHYTNLCWKPKVPIPLPGQYVSGFYLIDDDGNIFDEGIKMSVSSIIFDSDTALFITIDPYFNDLENSHVYVDKVVENAVGYVLGNKAALAHPVVLHRDFDRLNFKRDNLLWVEYDSGVYQDYLLAKLSAKRQSNIDLNPSVKFPEFMQPKQ